MKGDLSEIKFNGLVLLSGQSKSAYDVLEFRNCVWIPKEWLLKNLNRGKSSNV